MVSKRNAVRARNPLEGLGMKRAVLLIVLLSGCAQEPPTPFKTGVEVPPPHGCVEYRKRGGQC